MSTCWVFDNRFDFDDQTIVGLVGGVPRALWSITMRALLPCVKVSILNHGGTGKTDTSSDAEVARYLRLEKIDNQQLAFGV